MTNDNDKDFIDGMFAAAQNPITNLDDFSVEELAEKASLLIAMAEAREEKEAKTSTILGV
jgi:hypothetical protein